MKIDGLKHPKTKELSFRLEIPLAHAIGLLELMWAFTAQQTPQGNIGKWSNQVIASESGWEGDADQFCEALIETGFLDLSDGHRLLIHDWQEHCPNWVRSKLKKAGKQYLSNDLRGDLRESTANTSTATTSQDKPRQAKAKPSQAKTSVAKTSNDAAASCAQSARVRHDKRFAEFWDQYPNGYRKAKKTCTDIWKRKKLDGKINAILADLHTRKSQDDKWLNGFVPNPSTYLNQERWLDDITQPRGQKVDGSDEWLARHNTIEGEVMNG